MVESLLPGLSAFQNIHPIFVHFPIAFFLGTLAMEVVAIFRHEKFHLVVTWMLFLGTLSAIMTLPTRFYAADLVAATDPRGHAAPWHDFIHIHRNWMVATTAVGIFLTGYLFWINKKGNWASQRWGLLLGLVILSVMVTLGADRGGRLVFEFGTGVNSEVLKETTKEAGHRDNHGDGQENRKQLLFYNGTAVE